MSKQTSLKINSANSQDNNASERTSLLTLNGEEELEYIEDLEHDGILMSESMIFTSKKADLFKILIISFLFFTAMGIGASSRVIITLNRICFDLCPLGDGSCDFESSQKINSQINSIFMFLSSLICLIVAGKIGEFSDIYGRKITLVLSLTFLFIAKACCTYLILNGEYKFNVVLFIMASCMDALFGGLKSFMSTIRTFAADISTEADRVSALSSVMGSLFVGVAMGPTINTILQKCFPEMGNIIPLYIELTIMFSLIIAVTIFIREVHYTNNTINISNSIASLGHIEPKSVFQHLSESTKALRLFRIKVRFPPFQQFNNGSEINEEFEAFEQSSARTKNLKIFILLINNCVMQCVTVSVIQVTLLYFTYVLGWQSADLSYFLMTTGITKAVQAFIVIPAYNQFTARCITSTNISSTKNSDLLSALDLFNLRFSAFMILLEICILSMASNKIHVTFAIIVGSFGILGMPVSHHVLVKLCKSNIFSREINNGDANDDDFNDGNESLENSTKLGEFFGAISLLENLFLMVITPTMLWIYGATVKNLPQAAFIFIGSLLLICNILLWCIKSD